MLDLKRIIKSGLYLVFLLPLIFTPWTLYPSHFGKTILFQIIVDVLVVFSFYYLVLKQKKIAAFKVIDWALIIFIGVMLLSAIFGMDFSRSFWGDQSRAQGVFTLIHFILFYLLLRQIFANLDDFRPAIKIILTVSAVSSLIAWFGPKISFLSSFIPKDQRISGLIGNPIGLAGYLIIPTFLAFFYYFYLSNAANDIANKSYNCKNWIFILIGILNLITIIGTQTRGPFLGLLSGVFSIIILYLILGTRKKVKIGSAIIILMLGIIFGAGYVYEPIKQYMPAKLSFIYEIKPSAVTGKTRLMAWDIAIKGWKNSPILGNGPETYQYIFDKYYNPEFLSYSFKETVWDKPHNFILEMLNSAGIMGLFVYLAIIFLAIKILWGLIKGNARDSRKISYIILLGGIIAYIVHLQFFFESSNTLHLWLFLLAFMMFLYEQEGKHTPVPSQEGKYGGEVSKFPSKRGVRGVLNAKGAEFLFVLLIILSVFSLRKNYLILKSSILTASTREAAIFGSKEIWRKKSLEAIKISTPFRWEQAMSLTHDLVEMDGFGRLKKEDINKIGPIIEDILLKKINSNQDKYVYKFWLGQLYVLMGEYTDSKYYDEAEKILLEAWEINKDRQQIPLLLGKMYFLQNEKDKAINVLRELANSNPNYDEPHWFFGLVLMSAGKEEEGIIELEKGKRFARESSGNALYLIDIYAQREEFKKIVPLYEFLIAQEPNNASYYASLAATYMKIGEIEKAISSLNKAVELDPSLREEAIQFLKDNRVTL